MLFQLISGLTIKIIVNIINIKTSFILYFLNLSSVYLLFLVFPLANVR